MRGVYLKGQFDIYSYTFVIYTSSISFSFLHLLNTFLFLYLLSSYLFLQLLICFIYISIVIHFI